jgi:hypothetical protein
MILVAIQDDSEGGCSNGESLLAATAAHVSSLLERFGAANIVDAQ